MNGWNVKINAKRDVSEPHGVPTCLSSLLIVEDACPMFKSMCRPFSQYVLPFHNTFSHILLMLFTVEMIHALKYEYV